MEDVKTAFTLFGDEVVIVCKATVEGFIQNMNVNSGIKKTDSLTVDGLNQAAEKAKEAQAAFFETDDWKEILSSLKAAPTLHFEGYDDGDPLYDETTFSDDCIEDAQSFIDSLKAGQS